MGIYGESVLLVTEKVDKNREYLMWKIEESIRKSLFEIGVDAQVSTGLIFGGTWGFKRHKRDSFEVQVSIDVIDEYSRTVTYAGSNSLTADRSSTSYTYDNRAAAENRKNQFNAMQAITKNINKIKANLKKDIKEVEVKVEVPKENIIGYGIYLKVYVVEK